MIFNGLKKNDNELHKFFDNKLYKLQVNRGTLTELRCFILWHMIDDVQYVSQKPVRWLF